MTAETILLVLVASLVGAFVKAITGMGYPLLAVPIMTLALGIEDAVVIVAVPNMVANTVLCWRARDGRDDSRDLKPLVWFGFLGAFVGTFAFVNVPEDPLLVVLILTILGFVFNFVRHPELTIDPTVSRRWSPVVGSLAGIMQGAVGVSGPVVATWMHGYRLSKQAYVFSVTLIFGVSGGVQLVLLAVAGKFTVERSQLSCVAMVAVALMVPLGTAARHRLAGPWFDRAVLAVLLVSGLSLVAEVVQ